MGELQRTAKEMLAATRDRITEVDPSQAHDRLQDDDTVFLDVRDADEVRGNDVIPGSEHVSRGMVEFKADPESSYHDPAFDPDQRYVCYCVVGLRSAFVTDRLQEMGYDIVNLAGGITAWKDAEYPVTPAEKR
jgi:rhodanese-related sulfurtransferase